ncbi:MRR1 Multidrug resistance regulator 1 [Candida maltosa Xu316]
MQGNGQHPIQVNHQYLPPPPPLPQPPPPPQQHQQLQHHHQQQGPPPVGPHPGYHQSPQNHSSPQLLPPQMAGPTPPILPRTSNNGSSNHSSPNRSSAGSLPSVHHQHGHSNSISLPLPPPPPPMKQSLSTNGNQNGTENVTSNPPSNPFPQHPAGSPIPSIYQLSPSYQRLKSVGSSSDGVESPSATSIVVNDLLNPSRISNNTDPNASIAKQESVNKMSTASSVKSANDADDEEFYSNSLVSIPLGPNSTLQIDARDTMDVFTNANFSLNLAGNEWQQSGTLSYLGLTKSDPFITILRNFTVHLFRSDEISNIIRDDTTRKRRNSNGSLISFRSSRTNATTKRPKLENNGITELTPSNNLTATPMNATPSNDSSYFSQNMGINDNFGMSLDASTKMTNSMSTPLNNDMSPLATNESPKKTPQDLSNANFFYTGTMNNKQEYYKFVEESILAILPDKTNSFQLFCKYFKYVNPFNPLVDEHTLLLEINPILPKFLKFNHERFTQIKIKNDNDLRTLGIFLIILKFGYQTMIHNDNEYNNYDQEDSSIIEDMQKIETPTFIHAINLCIADGLTASKSSFKLVQLLTLLYHYKGISPDDSHGLCGADSQNLLGIIIRHAFSIGMNRDPTRYTDLDNLTKNQVLIKTWRFLWWYLAISDAMSALNTGCNLNIMSLDICDVEHPLMTEDPSGEMNTILETVIRICQIYRNIVNKINNLTQKPRVIDILKETNVLERIFFDFFGKDFFKDVICKPAKQPLNRNGFDQNSPEYIQSIIKVFKFCLFIQLRTNLSGMYYKIAIHYENEYDKSKTPSMKAGIELFKISIKSVVQLVYIMSYVLDNSVELFGKNFDYYLTAVNERYMIKTHSFLTSFFVRLLHQKKELSFKVFKEISFMSRLEDINNLFDLVLEDAELFVGNFRKMSRTYINSYRLYIMTYIILRQCVDNADAFFEKAASDQSFFYQGTNMIEFFSSAELKHLCRLCKEFRNAKEQQQKLKNEKKKRITGEVFDDPLKDLESKLFGTNINLSFFDDENIFSNLNNLGDDILDPVACKADLLRLFNIYGDFDNELLEK